MGIKNRMLVLMVSLTLLVSGTAPVLAKSGPVLPKPSKGHEFKGLDYQKITSEIFGTDGATGSDGEISANAIYLRGELVYCYYWSYADHAYSSVQGESGQSVVYAYLSIPALCNHAIKNYVYINGSLRTSSPSVSQNNVSSLNCASPFTPVSRGNTVWVNGFHVMTDNTGHIVLNTSSNSYSTH